MLEVKLWLCVFSGDAPKQGSLKGPKQRNAFQNVWGFFWTCCLFLCASSDVSLNSTLNVSRCVIKQEMRPLTEGVKILRQMSLQDVTYPGEGVRIK